MVLREELLFSTLVLFHSKYIRHTSHCSSYPLTKKLILVEDGDRGPKSVKMQKTTNHGVIVIPQPMHLQHSPYNLRLREHCKGQGRKIVSLDMKDQAVCCEIVV